MKLYIYKIFDLNTSSYFSEAYFNTEDASQAVYSAIKQNPNVELHKLFLTHIVDLTCDEEEEQKEFTEGCDSKHIYDRCILL